MSQGFVRPLLITLLVVIVVVVVNTFSRWTLQHSGGYEIVFTRSINEGLKCHCYFEYSEVVQKDRSKEVFLDRRVHPFIPFYCGPADAVLYVPSGHPCSTEMQYDSAIQPRN